MIIMKRIIALSLILLSSLCWGQKINKDIIGLRVGGYSFPESVERKIRVQYDKGCSIYQYSSYHSVTTYDIPFAGELWNKLTVKITNGNRIAEISFYKPYNSVMTARESFEKYHEMLKQKYGEPRNNQSNYSSWGEKTCVSIELTSKSTSSHGLVYGVTITYYDEKYLQQIESDIIEEL